MGNVIRMLMLAALRHYRDPLSWAGIIAAIGAATHSAIPTDYVPYIEGILGSVVGILLLAADGRKNPNTTLTGAISERPQIPAGTSPVFTPTAANGHGGVIVPNDSLPPGTTVVSTQPGAAGDAATATGRRPGFGPTID